MRLPTLFPVSAWHEPRSQKGLACFLGHAIVNDVINALFFVLEREGGGGGEARPGSVLTVPISSWRSRSIM